MDSKKSPESESTRTLWRTDQKWNAKRQTLHTHTTLWRWMAERGRLHLQYGDKRQEQKEEQGRDVGPTWTMGDSSWNVSLTTMATTTPRWRLITTGLIGDEYAHPVPCRDPTTGATESSSLRMLGYGHAHCGHCSQLR